MTTVLRLTMTLGLGILFYIIGNNEPKQEKGNEPKTVITPTYSLTRNDLICMLRNAETERRKNGNLGRGKR